MIKDNKGMAFIAAFSIFAILMVLTVTFLQMTDSDLNIATNYRDTAKALYIAEGGIEYGIYKILENWGWDGVTDVNLGDGKFTVEVSEPEPPDGRKILTSTGTCIQALAQGKILTSKRKVQVTINPTAFRYPVISTGNVTLVARFSSGPGLVGMGDEGNVHSNKSVTIQGDYVDVQGDITEGSPTVFIPDVDLNDYFKDPRQPENETEVEGDLIIDTGAATSGIYNNRIVYRTGTITISADTGAINLNGTTLVAENGFIINGDYAITIDPDSEPLADTAYPSLVTVDGDITGYFNDPDNSKLELLIYTKNGQINLDNLVMDKGSVIAGAGGLRIRATKNKKFTVIYDNSIIDENKPKYFTTPVDAAGLLWEEVY